MIIDDDLKVDDLLADFCAKQCLLELNRAILDHATDGWLMTRLARHFGATPDALHRRKRELLAFLRVPGAPRNHRQR